jgi:glycosyltransferase involved in cell wall biosynthesis
MNHSATMLMAISNETKTQLVCAGIPKNKIQVVFDTIEIDNTLKRSEEPLMAPLPGLSANPKILLAASLYPTKGQHIAIQAIARLKQKGSTPTLWLAGNKYGNDQGYVHYLHDLVKSLKLSENVYFLDWRNDVPAIMTRSDIVIVPSKSEGFCHVILEAMLLKKPVVATPVGGIKDSVENGKTGLFFPVDDYQCLADQIYRLANDKQCVQMLVENAVHVATDKFSPKIHTQRILHALTEAIRIKKGNYEKL